ncbi:aspartyl aminopeptidase [Aquimarina amphilecti]|uniref:M18 family aminopeptidase n=1 Tax=Aquimarina amphilecti TaxID=1038014 RepID=A0A1H7QNX4_AQUAM|nr:M18 family aminopeptidase [Aquimarina amphilecti]SEL49666.1 aspartyl aminopeptidase [Aquimarina amphilecti]
MSYTQNLLNFIDSSSTSFHVVSILKKELISQNYQELFEKDNWDLKKEKKYFVTRADGSIIVFRTPKKWSNDYSFKIIGAHTDSPCLKIKNNPISTKEGYQLLNIEIYGGVLLSSWFDRDLHFGGRLIIENEAGVLEQKLITVEKKLRIPRLAIHLDREVNKTGFTPNPQEHMFPIIGLSNEISFENWLKEETGISGTILSWDLFLFDAEKSSFGGISNEFIYAPRLDNLASVHASFEALKQSVITDNEVQMAVYFQHEEIGSESQNGANSNFLETTLKRIHSFVSSKEETYFQSIARSFFISADMAHAVHPNYTSKHDANHKPIIGAGPVIKSNANMRYATDAFSIAKFKQWCKKSNVPFQDFCSRNDIGCGSTIGPMVASNIGIPTIDVGNPMLSMHSIREMCGTQDHEYIIEVFTEFYNTSS